jgi:thioredoxin reductase
VEVAGLFLHPPFAEQLGLELQPSDCIRADALDQTSRPGVVAAGDLAHVQELAMPMASVLGAAAAGMTAAATVVRVLAAEEVAGPR